MYRRYYSYNDMPQVVHKPPKRDPEKAKPQDICKKEPDKGGGSKAFGNFSVDDIILGVIILAILMDDGDDALLILALAVILLSGIM